VSLEALKRNHSEIAAGAAANLQNLDFRPIQQLKVSSAKEPDQFLIGPPTNGCPVRIGTIPISHELRPTLYPI
jgi:hypothetical protein